MTAVYRGYTRAALDGEYDLRSRVADAAVHIAYREAESARIRETAPCRLDIAYGATPAGALDLFPASTGSGGSTPALIYIHGGYWHLSDKSDTSYIAPAITGSGIAFLTLNYGLAPAVTVDDIVRQVRDAIAWIARNAEALGIDRDRIVVSGHSAGGHLAAMAAATDWPAYGEGLPADLIKGVCALSGLYELEPIRLCFLNDVLGLDAESAGRNSPIGLRPRTSGPILLAVGADETDEFLRQQAAFADAWASMGADIRTMEVPGAHHYSIVRVLADASSALCRAVVDVVAPAGKRGE